MKKTLILMIALCVLGVAAGSAAYGQKAAPAKELSAKERDELLKFREQVWRDFFAGNKAALEKALPENFIGMGWGASENRFSDRATTVANADGFAKAGGKLTRLEFPETKIQSYGDLVVLYIKYELDLETGGKKETHKGHGTEFFVRIDGKWMHPGWHLDNY